MKCTVIAAHKLNKPVTSNKKAVRSFNRKDHNVADTIAPLQITLVFS